MTQAMHHRTSGLTFDPRTKLAMLLAANLLMVVHADVRVEAVMAALLLTPLFLSGATRTGLRLGGLYAALLAVEWWAGSVMAVDGAGAAASDAVQAVGVLAAGMRMMTPCLIAGTVAFRTTSVSEFTCAMRRMRVPESVVVPCMVVVRFFPTIAHDYRRIREAMALRGIARGRFAPLRHPVASLEHVLTPLLMNAAFVARDLSVAALTKGLGIRGERTCMTPIRMRRHDWIAMAACAAPFALAWGGAL